MAETTHLICAHCGGDNEVSNHEHAAPTQTLTLTLRDGFRLTFRCSHCHANYLLPINVGESSV